MQPAPGFDPGVSPTLPTNALANAPAAAAPDLQELLKRAITLIAGKRYADARALLDDAISRKPDFADAFFYRGNAYAGLGQPVRAMADYSRTIELDPKMTLAWFQRSSLHEQLKEYGDAVRDGDQAIKLAPEFWGAYLVRGRSYYAQDMRTEARRDFERVLELSPDCEEARVLLAAMPMTPPDDLGNETLVAALADLDHTISLAPNRADLHTKRGVVLLAMKRPKDALDEFRKSLALMPDKNFNAWLHRGQAWLALDQPRKALDDYNHILAVNPVWLPALTERGRVWLSLGEFDQAQRDYERALRSGDRSVNTILMAGLCAIQLGKDDHALEIFVQAEKDNRAGPDRFELRGLTYASLEHWPAAVADYTQAIERRPGIGRLYFYRCVAEARLNQMDEALADALKGLAAKDVEPRFRLQLALLAQGWLREQGRNDEARSLLAKQKIETGGAWPGSVVRFLRGEMTWPQLQRAAGDDEQRSEAYAYAGWLDLLEGRPGTGREKLQWVIDHGDKKAFEFELARRLLGAA